MKPLLVLMTTAIASSAALAGPMDDLRFSGFGTVGAAHSKNRTADYLGNFDQPNGVGRTTTLDYGLDSVLGLQADTKFSDSLTATAQLVSRRITNSKGEPDADGNLPDGISTPYFEWANIKYKIQPDLSVRAGRVVAPMFMVSESRLVSYAQTAVRMAPEVYGVNPISYVDGGGINYNFVRGKIFYSTNITAGKLTKIVPTGFIGPLETDFNCKLANISAELGASTLRFGYSRVDADFINDNLALLSDGVDILIAQGVPGAEKYQRNLFFRDIKLDFWDVGYVYDDGTFLAQAEAVWRRSESYFIQDSDALVILGGYRLNAFTFYAQYAQKDDRSSSSAAPFLDSAGLSGFSALIADSANELNATVHTLDERKAWAVGVRWDLKDRYALKLQYDRVLKPAGQTSFFARLSPEAIADSDRFNILSATLDFVF